MIQKHNQIILSKILNPGTKLAQGDKINLRMSNIQIRNPWSVRAKARLLVYTTIQGYVLDKGVSQEFTPVARPLTQVSIKPVDLQTNTKNVNYTFELQAGGPIP